MKLIGIIATISFLILILNSCIDSSKYPDGGYNYPTNINRSDSNFYFLPLKNVVNKKDSVLIAEITPYYQGFNEPNLSISPSHDWVFRFSYDNTHVDPLIITLLDNRIIIKRGHFPNRWTDSVLTPNERLHYHIFIEYFPIPETKEKHSNRVRLWLDSLIKIYPELLQPSYYLMLKEKMFIKNREPFTYTKTEILLSKKDYNDLINSINKAGFWKYTYEIPSSVSEMDAFGYILEGCTSKRYNMCSSGFCDTATKLDFAVQKLINFAGLGSEINLVGNSQVVH